MGDGLFNKFKILIGVEDAEEEREVQTVSAAPVAAVPAGAEVRRAQPAYPDRNNTFVQPRMDHNRENKVVSMQNTGKNSLSSW